MSCHDADAALDRVAAAEYEDDPEPELKACPFCGDKGAVVSCGGPSNPYRIQCRCCGVKTEPYLSELTAIERWNTRAETEVERAARDLVKAARESYEYHRVIPQPPAQFRDLCRALGEPTTDEWGGDQ